MLTLLSSMLLCGLLTWLLFGVLFALGYRLLQPVLRNIDPDQATKLILTWLALPPLAAVITTTVMYSPDLSQWLVTGHCHSDTCQQHGPQSALAIWPTAALLIWVGTSIGGRFFRQWHSTRLLFNELSRTGSDAGGFTQLDTPEPAAFALGWWKPTIFITTGMLSDCSPQDIDCILAHEKAHRLRHDNLRLLIARLFAAPLPSRLSATALTDLELSCEKASDLLAAKAFSRDAVAGAILRAARVQQRVSPIGSLAFAETQTELRIRALLDKPAAPLANEYVFAGASAALLFVLFAINPLHRVLELIP
jgi:Zn-dependent protease with chaperone function